MPLISFTDLASRLKDLGTPWTGTLALVRDRHLSLGKMRGKMSWDGEEVLIYKSLRKTAERCEFLPISEFGNRQNVPQGCIVLKSKIQKVQTRLSVAMLKESQVNSNHCFLPSFSKAFSNNAILKSVNFSFLITPP